MPRENQKRLGNPPYIATIHVLTRVTSHTLLKCQEINFRLFNELSEMTFIFKQSAEDEI